MAPKPRGTRQALEWMPFKIVPDDSERGYRTTQLIPTVDPVTGATTFEMHAYSPSPTVEDGYHVTAIVEVDPVGAAVTRIEVEPSPTILEDGRHRPRRPDEARRSPVNSSTLSLLKFTDMLNRIAEVEQMYADFLSGSCHQAGVVERLAQLKRRRPRKDPATASRHAEEALASMHEGRGYLERLLDQWGIGLEGVKKRISRLRADGWLAKDYGKAGETLIAWRTEHTEENGLTVK